LSEIAAPTVPAATGSSFYLAMRILPRDRRTAMYAVYDFCRAVDDIADGGGPSSRKLADLERWRADIDDLFATHPPQKLGDLAEAARRFSLRQADFDAVIDGMAMDAAGDIRAPDWATLDLYCDRVASAVGRISVRVFGMRAEPGEALAHHLGRALQLTNILRDIDEDAAIGRLYLPREALNAAGVFSAEPLAVAGDPGLPAACAEVVTRARAHFDRARRIMAEEPRGAVRAPWLMAAAYGSILDGLVARGFAQPRQRVRTSRMRVLRAFLLHGLL
jgi:phytoene synthase